MKRRHIPSDCTGRDKPGVGKAERRPRFPASTQRFSGETSGRTPGQARTGQFNRILLNSGLVYYTPTGARY